MVQSSPFRGMVLLKGAKLDLQGNGPYGWKKVQIFKEMVSLKGATVDLQEYGPYEGTIKLMLIWMLQS